MTAQNAVLVYLVDDDPAVRDSLQSLLESVGLRTQSFADTETFLTAYRPDCPGCLLLDVRIPGRNDLSSQQLLRDRGIKTIALTQSGSPVANAADVVISVNLPEGQNIFRASSTRYAFLAAVDILANLVAYADRNRSAKLLRGIKQQLIRHRDGDDRQLLGD